MKYIIRKKYHQGDENKRIVHLPSRDSLVHTYTSTSSSFLPYPPPPLLFSAKNTYRKLNDDGGTPQPFREQIKKWSENNEINIKIEV